MLYDVYKPVTSLSVRIAFPAILTVLLFSGAALLLFLPAVEDGYMARKQEMIHELTESAWSIFNMLEVQAENGLLTRETAQNGAIALIRELRYGPERKDYFWIMDMHPRMVMHPYRLDLEGLDLTDYADSQGKKIFTECVRIVRESGAGYITYEWQWKDDPKKLAPKLSYIKGFEPWEWIIGSGIYTDDVRTEIAKIRHRMLGASAGILVIIFMLIFYIIRQAVLAERMRKQTNATLQKSEKRYKELANSLPQFVFETDSEGILTFANRCLLEILGLDQIDSDCGVSAVTALVLEDRDRALAAMGSVMNGEKTGNHEFTAQDKNGRTFPVLIHIECIVHDNNPSGVRGIAIDITDQKTIQSEMEKLEARMHQSMKMETIGTLAGGIAHDFNNILAVILGYADLTRENLPKGEPNHYNIEQILHAGYRAKDLVKQILAFSRQSKQEKHPLHIELILKEAQKFLRASLPATIGINLEITARKKHVFADATQIHQVIMNLCTNAAYAMKDKGGEINILLTDEFQDQAVLSNYPNAKQGTYLCLKVSDSGPGIPPDIMDRIFDPFFTTKERGEGTGMGLAIVHGIVNDHGGFIEVESTLGKGSTVKVYLPKHEGNADLTVKPAAPTKEGSEGILFVDDEELIVQLADQMFKKLGYDIVTTTRSTEALEILHREPDRFHIIITDLTMPNLTGLQLAEKALSVRPDIPIILCTGFGDSINEEEAKAAGIVEIICKPPLMRDMANAVRSALDNKNAAL